MILYQNYRLTKYEECIDFFHSFRVKRMDGMYTLVSKKNGMPLKDRWYKTITPFSKTYYKVSREDGMFTLVDGMTGEYAYGEDFWVYNIKFGGEYFLVEREDSLFSPISKIDGKYIFDNIWCKSWDFDFSSTHILIKDEYGKFNLIDRVNGKLIFENPVQDIQHFQSKLCIIKDHDLYNIFDLSNGKSIFNASCIEGIIKNDLVENCLIIVTNDKKYTLVKDRVLSKWYKCISFLDEKYVIVSEDGEKYTLFSINDNNEVYENVWYKSWHKCCWNPNYYLVSNDGKMYTLLLSKTGKEMFPGLLFSSWGDFDEDYFYVGNADGLRNLLSKKDGKILFNGWYETIFKLEDGSYLVD